MVRIALRSERVRSQFESGHTDTPTLQFENVTVGYESADVVRELNLTVERGAVVALLGPNGAGKTTSLLTAAGALRPRHGRILLDGQEIAAGRPDSLARRGVAFVPEDRGLFSDLTVLENLRVGIRSKSDVDYAIDMLPALRKLMRRKVGLLSGGEQQMLALGRALGRRPRLLLIDEMSLGLAPQVVATLLGLVHDLTAETGTSVLLVEQHVGMALEHADAAYVMVHGRVVLNGAAADLRSRMDEIRASYFGEISSNRDQVASDREGSC